MYKQVKEWRINNPEKYREQCIRRLKVIKEQRINNPISYKSRMKSLKKAGGKWRIKNPEKVKEYRGKYQKENSGKIKEYQKKYQKENSGKIKEYQKKYKNSEKVKYIQYKNNAKERNYEFNLSYKQFIAFWQKPCSYCGDKIGTIGLDRVDNSKGYSIDNIISCCKVCNRMKMKQTKEEFIEKCGKIHRYYLTNKKQVL